MYEIQVTNGVITSFILGWCEGWEQAPEGFTPENAREWVKIDGKWVRDKERANENETS